MAEPKYIGTGAVPQTSSTRLTLLAKKLGAFQNIPGSNPAYNPRREDTARMLMVKLDLAKNNLRATLTLPTPTGLTLSFSGSTPIANWDAVPSGVTGTEVWVSTDNVTFVLAVTAAAPATSQSTGLLLAVGATAYVKIRFTNGTLSSAFTAVASIELTFGQDWSNRVVANGGAAPSQNSIDACTTLLNGYSSDGVLTKMAYILGFPNDSLIAALTPLWNPIAGNDPATNVGPFVVGDLSVAGLNGNSANYLKLGFTPANLLTFNGVGAVFSSMRIAIYMTVNPSDQGTFDVGAVDADVNHQTLMSTTTGGQTYWDAPYKAAAGRIIYAGNVANSVGLYSGNRTSLTSQDVWRGAVTPTKVQSNATDITGAIAAGVEFYVFTVNNNNGAPFGPINRRLSMVEFGAGLSDGEMAIASTRMRDYRTAIGGGNPA